MKGIKARPYSFLLSSIGNTALPLNNDDANAVRELYFSEITIKIRSMGTNTNIDVGGASVQAFRFKNINDSFTFHAPFCPVKLIPLVIHDIWVKGDTASGAGVIEIIGIGLSDFKDVV